MVFELNSSAANKMESLEKSMDDMCSEDYSIAVASADMMDS